MTRANPYMQAPVYRVGYQPHAGYGQGYQGHGYGGAPAYGYGYPQGNVPSPYPYGYAPMMNYGGTAPAYWYGR